MWWAREEGASRRVSAPRARGARGAREGPRWPRPPETAGLGASPGRRGDAHRERVIGFGHAGYRTKCPRSRMLREVAQGFGGQRGDCAVEVERHVESVVAEPKSGRDLVSRTACGRDACRVARNVEHQSAVGGTGQLLTVVHLVAILTARILGRHPVFACAPEPRAGARFGVREVAR
jgi:hypothetical protein